MAAIAHRTGCGILLDVDNVYVSARNHGFNPRDYPQSVGPPGGVDTYGEVLSRFGPVPTLVEWDTEIPPLAVLLNEAGKAEAYLAEARRVLAA